MHWLLLAIVSAVMMAITRILQKVLLKDEQSDPYAFAVVFQLTVAMIFFVYILATNSFELPPLSGLLINIILMTVLYGLGNFCVFLAFKHAEASEVSIIFATSTVWSVISAMLFLGEKLNKVNVLGILLIVAGVIIINYTHTKWKPGIGHAYALVGAALFGIAFTNDAYIINRFHNVASYVVWAFTLPGLFLLICNPKTIKQLKHYLCISVFKNVLLCALFYALSAITIYTAYKTGGKASIISPLQQTSIIFTVVLSYIILKEKDKPINKIFGTILAFGGVLLLV